MGTRSIIIITGKDRYGGDHTERLYKHWDGYPTGNLPIIAEAIEKSLEIHWRTSRGTSRGTEDLSKPLNAQMLSCAVKAASLGTEGFGASTDKDWDGDASKDSIYAKPFNPEEHLGNQGDLEWIYIINAEDRSLTVHRASWDCDLSKMIETTTDPLDYINQIRDEYQTSEAHAILAARYKIETLGYSVNKKPRGKVTSIKTAKKKAGAK